MAAFLQKNTIEYQKRIQKALIFIQENLDKPLTLKEVAKAASFSEYHFHRIFSAAMEETPGEYITRKKLERAANKLAYSSRTSVSQVAIEFGYSSVSSFSKAFKQWFGIRPSAVSEVKKKLDAQGGKLQILYEKALDVGQLFVAPEEPERSKRFKELDSRVEVRSVSGFSVHCLSSPYGYDIASIRATWMELTERLEDAGIEMARCELFAISHDHPGLTAVNRCRYDACVLLPQDQRAALSLPVSDVPSGRYAIFRVEGPETSILEQYLEFYTVWMAGSDYEPDNFPVLEHYLPDSKEGHIVVELWAKIKRLSF